MNRKTFPSSSFSFAYTSIYYLRKHSGGEFYFTLYIGEEKGTIRLLRYSRKGVASGLLKDLEPNF